MLEEHVSLPDFYMAWLMATSEVQKLKSDYFAPDLLKLLGTRLAGLLESRAFKMALHIDPRFNYRGSMFFSPEEKMEIQVIFIQNPGYH